MRNEDSHVNPAGVAEGGICSWRWIALGVGLGVVCMFLYGRLWPDAPYKSLDSDSYMQLGADMRGGSMNQLYERTPGYPLLLVLTGATQQPTRSLFYTQLVLHFVAVLLVVVLLVQLRVGAVGVLAFMVLGSLPPMVEPAARVLTENLTMFWLAIGLVSLMQWIRGAGWGWIVLAGAAFGFSALTRPALQLVAFALAAALVGLAMLQGARVLSRIRLCKAAAVVLVIGVVMVGSVVMYNYHRFQFPGLSPRFGPTLCIKTLTFLERLPDEYGPVREVLIRNRDAFLVAPDGDHRAYMYIWPALPEVEQVTGLSGGALSRYMAKLNLDLIQRAPLQYLREVVQAMGTYFTPTAGLLASFNSRIVQLLWGVLHVVILGTVLVHLALLTGPAWLYWRYSIGPTVRSPEEARLAGWRGAAMASSLAILAYNMLVSTFLETGSPRYRQPTDMLLLFVGILAVDGWWRLRRSVTNSGVVVDPVLSHYQTKAC